MLVNDFHVNLVENDSEILRNQWFFWDWNFRNVFITKLKIMKL